MEYEEYTYEHLDGEVKIDSTLTISIQRSLVNPTLAALILGR